MKLVFASDIHGSAHWCEALLNAFHAEGADKLILLGDLLYHGPRNPLPDGYDPKKVFEMLNGLKDKILAVRGNCDSEVDQMVLKFPMMADYALLEECGRTLFLTHGHLFNADMPPILKENDLLFNGHFHTPENRPMEKGGIYVNVGSVSLPKPDTPHSYVLLDENGLYWKDLETGGIFDCMEL